VLHVNGSATAAHQTVTTASRASRLSVGPR
jgi:hypothetical protein